MAAPAELSDLPSARGDRRTRSEEMPQGFRRRSSREGDRRCRLWIHRVPEEAEILSFYAPGGGFEFLTFGHEPVLLEIPSTGHLLHASGAGGFGPEFSGTIPLVETVAGAPDASVESIDITLGSAIRRHGHVLYYGRVPKTCTRAGSAQRLNSSSSRTRIRPRRKPFRCRCGRLVRLGEEGPTPGACPAST